MLHDPKLAPTVVAKPRTHWGMTSGTQVLTAAGAIPVEELQAGARVISRDSGLVTLLGIEQCTIDCPIIRVRAGSLGHDRPERDTDLPIDQQILIRDWRAQALMGRDQALMAANRLEDGEFLYRIDTGAVAVLRLRFARDHVIYGDGLELFCPAID